MMIRRPGVDYGMKAAIRLGQLANLCWKVVVINLHFLMDIPCRNDDINASAIRIDIRYTY